VPTLTELIKLRLDELSGVDQPANLLDGWLVMKSAGTAIDNDAVVAFFKAAAQVNVASDGEQMRTLAPVYSPGRADHHGEHVSADELERAALAFTKSGPQPLSLQHHDFGRAQIGTVESMFVWPFEATVPIQKVGGVPRTVTLPAGTLYAWCSWTKAAWDTLVKTAKLNGLSVGGRAVRVPSKFSALPPMGDTIVGKAGRVLSTKNMNDLAACIAMLQELHSRGALPETTTKYRDGFLIADVAKQEVLFLAPDRIEVLGV